MFGVPELSVFASLNNTITMCLKYDRSLKFIVNCDLRIIDNSEIKTLMAINLFYFNWLFAFSF